MRTALRFVAAAGAIALLAVASVSYSIGTDAVPSAAAAQADYFLKIEGIEGTIEVQSFSWGAGIVAPRDVASGQSSGKRQYQPIIIRKRIDKTSPLLFRGADTGAKYKKVTLTRTSSDGTPPYTVTFQDVLISGFMHEGTAGSPPSETVSFSYQKIEMK